MNVKMICFDMDGTIANLYGVSGWLEKLRAFDPTPYAEAEPMWDMEELAEVLMALKSVGTEIRIITWLSKETTSEYDNLVREAKREWLEKCGFPFDNFHGVAYGTTKANCVRKYLDEGEAILIDDNAKVREGWHLGEAIDPTAIDIVEYLKGLLTE
jgi:phosphoglycolate phosphatase-like HAD superfamily hydrolase